MAATAQQQPCRLQNVEAQRIMAILEETHSKLELLSRVPPLQLPDEGDLRLVLGPEVLQVLQEQAMLEQQYEMVSAPQYEQRQDGDEISAEAAKERGLLSRCMFRMCV